MKISLELNRARNLIVIVFSIHATEGFELMDSRRQLQLHLLPSWQLSELSVPVESELKRIERFALDLLNAELILKRCDLEDCTDSDFDQGANYLSSMIPHLHSSMKEVENHAEMNEDTMRVWLRLKTRCAWLTASFYFWRGRLSTSVADSRCAEKFGLRYIEEAMEYLMLPKAHPVERIPTPHLESRKRKGAHWRELSQPSLSTFSSEIQASSVVLRAQEQFLEAITKIERSECVDLIQNDDREFLHLIGRSLLERYDTTIDSSCAKHLELIDDFISVYGGSLMADSMKSSQTQDDLHVQSWFDTIVHIGECDKISRLKPASQCILTILLVCLQCSDGNYEAIITLLTRLVITLTCLSQSMPAIATDIDGEQSASPVSDVYIDTDETSTFRDAETVHEEWDVKKCTQRAKQRQYAIFICLLMEKISAIFQSFLSESARSAYAQSVDLKDMLERIMPLTSSWFCQVGSTAYDGAGQDEDFEIFSAVKSLVNLLSISCRNDGCSFQNEPTYFKGMIKILASQRRIFNMFASTKPSNRGRITRVRTTRRRSDLIAVVSFEIGLLLSRHPFTVSSGALKRARLLSELSVSELSSLVDNVLGFWRMSLGSDDTVLADKLSCEPNYIGTYLDRFGKDRLRTPLAAAIVGLCGSGITNLPTFSTAVDTSIKADDEHTNLIEFYDSDGSTSELVSGVDNSDIPLGMWKAELLRVIMQSVHCINNIITHISEAEMAGYLFLRDYVSPQGPLLPLILVSTCDMP
jgi:hypothetical protein